MTIDSHASDCFDPSGSSINLASALVVAHNKKGGIGIVGLKQVKKGWSIVRRAVVESQGNGTRLRALRDRDTVGDVANKEACVS